MIKKFPLEFTLESGTHVVVNKTGTNNYEFSLTHKQRPSSHFTYTDDDRSKTEVEEGLDFEQLDAVRMFWLKKQDVV